MKLTTKKQTKDFADKYDIPEWRVEKAIHELATNDSIVLDRYFEQHTLNNRLNELTERSEEIVMLFHNVKNISRLDWEPILLRMNHLKTDIKQMIEEFAYIEPNKVGQVKEYIRRKGQLLVSGDIKPADFLVSLDVFLSEVK